MFAGIDNPESWAKFFFAGKVAFLFKKTCVSNNLLEVTQMIL